MGHTESMDCEQVCVGAGVRTHGVKSEREFPLVFQTNQFKYLQVSAENVWCVGQH